MATDPLDVLRGPEPTVRPDPTFVAQLRRDLLTRALLATSTEPIELTALDDTDPVEIDMNPPERLTRRWPVLLVGVAAAAVVVVGVALAGRDTGREPADRPAATTAAPAESLTPITSVATASVVTGASPWTMTYAGGDLWVVNSPGTGLERRKASTGELVTTIPMPFDVYADPPRADRESLWVATDADGKVRRVDLASGQVMAAIDIPDGIRPVNGDEPPGLAVDESGAWVVSGGVDRMLTLVDRATNAVTSRFPLTVPHPADLATGFGALWVTDGDRQLHRIDPADGRTVASITLATATGLVAVGDDAIWVLGPDQSSGTSLQRVDPTTNTVIATIKVSTKRPEIADLTAGNGHVWIRATPDDARLVDIDARTNTIVARYSGLSGGEGVALTDDAVWAVSASDRTLYRVPGTRS